MFKAFHIANSEYTGGLKSLQNLSLSNAQLQFLAVYLNQDTVQFDGRNIVCEKEDDVQYILSLISDSHFWLDKSMKGINEVVNNTDVIKDIKLSLSPFASLGELNVIDDEFKLKNKEFDGFAKLKVKYDVKGVKMAGALFSLSAGGVMFATAVVIIIFSAMLYDSIVKRRSKNINPPEFTGSPQLASCNCSGGTVLLYLDFDGVLHRRMNETFERMPLLEKNFKTMSRITYSRVQQLRETMTLEGLKYLFPVAFRHRIIGCYTFTSGSKGYRICSVQRVPLHARHMGSTSLLSLMMNHTVFHLGAKIWCQRITVRG